MATKDYLNKDHLLYFWTLLKSHFVAQETGKGLSTNDFTNELKTKLENTTSGTTDVATKTANGLMSSTDKTKLDGIAEGAQVNVIETVQVNGVALTPASKTVNVDLSSYAKADTTLAGYGIADAYTKAEVDAKTSAMYKPQGSIAFASLPTPSAANLGYAYNITDAFTTTDAFLEGAGASYPAGTNVVIVQNGTGYMFDAQSGIVDLSPYLKSADLVPMTNADIDEIVAQ